MLVTKFSYSSTMYWTFLIYGFCYGTIVTKLALSPLSGKSMDAILFSPSNGITNLCPLMLRLWMESQLLIY